VDGIGELSYSFNDVMASMVPYYGLRLIAGIIFLIGTILMAYNLFRTMWGRHTVSVSPPDIVDEIHGTAHMPEPEPDFDGSTGREVPA